MATTSSIGRVFLTKYAGPVNGTEDRTRYQLRLAGTSEMLRDLTRADLLDLLELIAYIDD